MDYFFNWIGTNVQNVTGTTTSSSNNNDKDKDKKEGNNTNNDNNNDDSNSNSNDQNDDDSNANTDTDVEKKQVQSIIQDINDLFNDSVIPIINSDGGINEHKILHVDDDEGDRNGDRNGDEDIKFMSCNTSSGFSLDSNSIIDDEKRNKSEKEELNDNEEDDVKMLSILDMHCISEPESIAVGGSVRLDRNMMTSIQTAASFITLGGESFGFEDDDQRSKHIESSSATLIKNDYHEHEIIGEYI